MWRGGARHGWAGRGLFWCRRGRAGQQLRQQHGGLRLSLLLSLEGSYGGARRGNVGCGAAGLSLAMSGQARADDLSTEPFGALCWVPWNPDVARRDAAGIGKAGRGVMPQGTPRARRWHGALRGSLPSSRGWTWHGKARLGVAWPGRARHGMARLGRTRQGAARAVDDSTEGQPSLLSSLRADTARPGTA